MKINEQKLTKMIFDYKVVDELFGYIIDCNFRLAQLADANEKWHSQNGDFFFFVEKRNQYINEIADILNQHAFSKKFEHVRIHKIDCYETIKEQLSAIQAIRKTIIIASKMEKTA